jgi:hypothetical protein
MADTSETKPAAAPATTQTKTAFVLGFPRELAAAEIVAKGKAAGFTMTLDHVHKIRSVAKLSGKKKSAGKKSAKAKAQPKAPAAAKKAVAKKSAAKPAAAPAAKKPAAPKPAAKKSAGTRTSQTNPKKAFIASQPSSMTAADVIAAAKKAGLSISLDYVYKARSKSRATKAPTAAPATKAASGRPKGSKNKSAKAPTSVKVKPVSESGSAMEHVLARFVVAHGANRVKEVLAAVEARVNDLFGGA